MMCRYIALAALFAAATCAHADELVPYQAESIELGNIHGVAYFTEVPSGDRVVVTLAEGEAGLPVRFEATLVDAQSLTISVPGKFGESGRVIEISRAGVKVIVSRLHAADDKFVLNRRQASGD